MWLVVCHSVVGRRPRHPAQRHTWRWACGETYRQFYKTPTAALQSLYCGHDKVRIKQLLPQTHAVKFVYEVNFNKKQTVCVVYKQSRAVKARECFVSSSPWASGGPGAAPAAPAHTWNQSQRNCPGMAPWSSLQAFLGIFLLAGLPFNRIEWSPSNAHMKNSHKDY